MKKSPIFDSPVFIRFYLPGSSAIMAGRWRHTCCGIYGRAMLIWSGRYQEYGRLPRPAFHKIYQFLMISGIHRLDEIDYAARMSYEKYLSECRIRKVGEHVKMLDWLKLEAIRKHEHPLRKERLAFEEQPLFLLYHPDYQTAMRFYFIQDKQDLVFDFLILPL